MNYTMIIKVCGVITLVLLALLQGIIGTIGFLLIALVIFILLFIFSFIRDRKLNNMTYTRDTRIVVKKRYLYFYFTYTKICNLCKI